MNPGGSVKDRAARNHRCSGEARHAEAGRNGRRGHSGQHGHRARACLQRARLSLRHRDAEQPVRGEVQAAGDARRRGAQGAGGALLQPEPVPAHRGAAGEAAAERDLVEPVRQHREPRRSLQHHGPRNLAPDGRQDQRVHLFQRHGRHVRRRLGVPEDARTQTCATVLADPPGSSLYEYAKNGVLKGTGSGSITEGIGIARVTANLATAKHRRCGSHRGPGNGDATFIGCCTRKGCSWAAPAASTSPPPCASRSSSAPATRS